MLVAVDVGATKIHAASFSGRKLLSQVRLRTPRNSKQALFASICATINSLNARPSKIGICAPGFVHNGIAYGLPNIGIMQKLPMQKLLAAKYKCKVYLQNDSKCFMLAEWKNGAAKGSKNALGVTFGSGIGGGIIINGKLYEGEKNQAGEFGHMKVQTGGIKCPCGGFGCWERYSSGSAIEYAYNKKTGMQKSAREILQSNNATCISISKGAAFSAGAGTASLANIFAPQIIVLGGSVSSAYMGKYKKEFMAGFNSSALPLIKKAKIRNARLQNPSLYGAMLLASPSHSHS